MRDVAVSDINTRMTSERFAAVSSSFASSRTFSLVPSEFGNLLSINSGHQDFLRKHRRDFLQTLIRARRELLVVVGSLVLEVTFLWS